MIHYLVTGVDGQRYGPADVDTLVSWARENRIEAATTLIETGTERELRADSLPALAAIFNPHRPTGGSDRGVFVERDPEPPTLTRAGVPHPPPPPPPIPVIHQVRVHPVGARSRVVAGLLGIFLGMFGAHRFYLGYTGVGLLMLFLSVGGSVLGFFCLPGASCGVVSIWGMIEGVICLLGGMRDVEGRELI